MKENFIFVKWFNIDLKELIINYLERPQSLCFEITLILIRSQNETISIFL